MSSKQQELKQLVANHAVTLVKPGMILGLGSGSTATLAIRRIGALLQQGQLDDIAGVPTSDLIAGEALRAGIPLMTLEAHPVIDLTIDGADEVDPQLNVIKGGGGALLREKIVAQASTREVIIVDQSKLSSRLGTKWHVPIEVVHFGWGSQVAFLQELGARVILRLGEDGEPFLTDHGNVILDSDFGPIDEPAALAALLAARAGIVEHGLFIGLTSDLLIGGEEGIQHVRL